MKTGAFYIAQAKVKLGNARMSDRKLGEYFGCSQSLIAQAKHGGLGDPLALKLARFLGVEPGEVLMVARLEREPRPEVKEALVAYAAKIFASASKTASMALAGMAVALGLSLQPLPAEAGMVGGVGRLRKR